MKNSYEEDYNGYTIYVEESADRWNPAFTWSVCKDDIEHDTGLEFTIDTAIQAAQDCIDSLAVAVKN